MHSNQLSESSDQGLSNAVTEFIDEYDRLVSALKKDFRKGKKLSCLSSLTAMKPLHSHLMETFVCNLESDSSETKNDESSKTESKPDLLNGYL